MIRPILTLLKKEFLLEYRQQHAFYGVLLYVASTIFVLYLSVEQPEVRVWNGLFWMIQLFICVNAVAKSFLQESRGRLLYYYSIVHPRDFILAKLVYNLFTMWVMSLLSLGLFQLFLGSPILDMSTFFGVVLLGSASLSLLFTLLSAIAARAQQNAALMAILGFPVIIPQLMLLMRMSRAAYGEIFRDQAFGDMIWLSLGLNALVIALSVILFPFLWKD